MKSKYEKIEQQSTTEIVAVILRDMKTLEFWKPIIVSLIVTPFVLFAGVVSAGGGHGDLIWFKVLFPYSGLQAFIFQSAALGILLMIVQFPVYGTILAFASKGKSFALTGLILTVVHISATVLCFVFLDTT
jgi:hypothetical protein